MEEEAPKSFFEKAKDSVSGLVDKGNEAVAGVMNKGKDTFTNDTGEPNVLLIVSIFLLMLVIYVIMYTYRQAKYSPYLILPVTPIINPGDLQVDSNAIPSSLFSEQYSYSMWVYISDDTFNNQPSNGDTFVILSRKGKGSEGYKMSYGIMNNERKRNLLIRYAYHTSGEPDLLGDGDMTDDVAKCDIENIPYNTFLHISTVVYGRTLVVYLNGILVKTTALTQKLAILNTGETISNESSHPYPSFKGYISKLRYFVDISKENGGALSDKQVYDLYLNSPYPSILEKIGTSIYNKVISFNDDGGDEVSKLSHLSSHELTIRKNEWDREVVEAKANAKAAADKATKHATDLNALWN
mgnify:CR=1 FL=1